jgi:hypothetical protein
MSTGTERASASSCLGNDPTDIELGFWGDEIWAQSDDPLFSRDESSSLDTTATEVYYELTIQEMSYLLTGDGLDLLTGPTRYYGDYFSGPVAPDPYEVRNFLFLGDNTDSAYASFALGAVGLETDLPLPAPPAWGLLLGGLALRQLERLCTRPKQS